MIPFYLLKSIEFYRKCCCFFYWNVFKRVAKIVWTETFNSSIIFLCFELLHLLSWMACVLCFSICAGAAATHSCIILPYNGNKMMIEVSPHKNDTQRMSEIKISFYHVSSLCLPSKRTPWHLRHRHRCPWCFVGWKWFPVVHDVAMIWTSLQYFLHEMEFDSFLSIFQTRILYSLIHHMMPTKQIIQYEYSHDHTSKYSHLEVYYVSSMYIHF